MVYGVRFPADYALVCLYKHVHSHENNPFQHLYHQAKEVKGSNYELSSELVCLFFLHAEDLIWKKNIINIPGNV